MYDQKHTTPACFSFSSEGPEIQTSSPTRPKDKRRHKQDSVHPGLWLRNTRVTDGPARSCLVASLLYSPLPDRVTGGHKEWVGRDLLPVFFFLPENISSSFGMGRAVHSFTLSVQHFLCRLQRRPPFALKRLLWCVTCSNNASFRLSIFTRRVF